MASNVSTTFPVSPPIPTCSLHPQPPILPNIISDNVLAIILPTIVYAIAGGFFHLLDTYQLFSEYRIHPSEDEVKRNHVTKRQCLQTVIRYHVLQISIGLLLNVGNGPTMIGDESCRILNAAATISGARNILPIVLATLGIDAKRLRIAMKDTSVGLAQILASDHPSGSQKATSFTSLELSLAKFAVHIGMPLFQYAIALAVVDTWIYFTHRLCHSKPLYRIVHAQHHRLYVSYAYGAVYGHWLETLFLDILSFVLAGEIARLSARQSMLFGACATIKTISDHCGYVFPWDPFRFVNGNGAVFHDLHHQSWGLKYNFSTYTVFWDRILGTSWTDENGARERYKRVHELTRKKGLAKEAVTDRLEERAVAERGDDVKACYTSGKANPCREDLKLVLLEKKY